MKIESNQKSNISKTDGKESKPKKAQPQYKQIKLLGQGSFGKAFLVENTSDKVNYFYLIF